MTEPTAQAPGVGIDPAADTMVSAVERAEVAPGPPGAPEREQRARSLWSDAWRELRHNPMFWISGALILVVVTMAVFPQWFASGDPEYANLSIARQPPSPEHIFGTDKQGYDVYTRTIYGARASILVGVVATLGVLVLGGLVGLVSGYLGGWVDSLLSRVGEIFLAIPLLLAGILFLYIFPSPPGANFFVVTGKVSLVIILFAWPTTARLMRSAVFQVKPNDYVTAARALGGSPWRIVMSHVLPNALAPILVIARINLGVYIALEATLSFLGIGLQPPAVSWGLSIADASSIGLVRQTPHMLIFPSIFLSVTVLAFIMLGDAVRDALDPKLR